MENTKYVLGKKENGNPVDLDNWLFYNEKDEDFNTEIENTVYFCSYEEAKDFFEERKDELKILIDDDEVRIFEIYMNIHSCGKPIN